MNICGIIAPRWQEIVGYRQDDYLPVCIMPRNHTGPHVVKTPEGVHIAWKEDWTCDCCTPDEEDRCITFWEITEKYIQNLS